MGVVYQARDPQIDRVVAVKVLRHDRISSDTFVNRFLKEAKVIGRLSHPNIVTIYDVGNEEENIYIAMEFLEGISLSDILRERRPAPDEAMNLGIQIAETLYYAHNKGVIHRDIKPSNIIVAPDGRIKITDFGIARIEDSSATLQTQAGEILGTPAYMSPEQIMGQPVDRRADIFSLGVILYEMTAGSRPFGGEGRTLASVFNDIIRITPPEPFIVSSLVPRKLSDIIMKALEKEPDKRFQTAGEMAEAIRECLRRDEPESDIKIQTGVQKKNYIIPAAVTMAGIILASGIYYLYQQMNSPASRHTVRQENIVTPKAISPVSVPESKEIKTVPAPEKEIAANRKPSEKIGNEKELTAPPPVIHEGKAPEPSRPVEAKKRPPVPAERKTAAILAPLTLRSAPQGASVYIDDNFKGRTPVTIMVPTGAHRVKLTLPGHHDAYREITMEETMEYPLMFNLRAVTDSTE